jgi:hypothetical protein
MGIGFRAAGPELVEGFREGLSHFRQRARTQGRGHFGNYGNRLHSEQREPKVLSLPKGFREGLSRFHRRPRSQGRGHFGNYGNLLDRQTTEALRELRECFRVLQTPGPAHRRGARKRLEGTAEVAASGQAVAVRDGARTPSVPRADTVRSTPAKPGPQSRASRRPAAWLTLSST